MDEIDAQIEFPNGWHQVSLKEVARHHSGDSKIIKGTLKSMPEDGLFVAYSATGGDVWRDSYDYEGDGIIISAVGARCGKCFRAHGKWSAIANTHIVWPDENIIDTDFLWFKINNENFWVKGGSAQPFVKTRESFLHEFLLPPLNEQRRIVEKIETLFAQLDAGEAALKQVQQQLARYRQSVLKAAVTGALTADWRAKNAHRLEHGSDLLARILKTRRENWQGRGKYKEPAAPDTDKLPELPQGWVWVSTEQIAFVETGATPKKGVAEFYENGEIPWITSTAVNEEIIFSSQDLITQEAINKTNAKLFPAGSLIVAMYGEGKTRGMVSELGIDAATNQACAALIVDHSPELIAKYLKIFYKYNYETIRQLSSGGVQPNLNLSIIKETAVPLPPVEEIEKITQLVDEAISSSEALDFEVQAQLTRAAALRQSILKDAFSGKLVPQDPNDEPADALLARIRAERAQNTPAKTARGRKPLARTKT